MSITVDVVVSQAQKEYWKTHAEETPKYDHLSDLVRTAVSEQIARDTGEEGVPDEVEDMFNEILTEMDEFQSTIEHSNEVIEDLEHRALDEESIERIVENQRELIEMKMEELNDE